MANGLRSTVRKLGQNGGGSEQKGVSCGAEDLVSGGMPPQENEQPPKGANPDNQGGSQSGKGLQQASAEVLTALHAAKEELAAELDANLKQLKTVLEETQRIQRQMEAVLNEARNSPSLQEKATGQGDQKGSGGWQAPAGGRKNGWKAPVKLGDQKGRKAGQKEQDTPQGAGQQSAGGQGDPQGEQEQGRQPTAWDQLHVGNTQVPAWEPPRLGPNPAGGPQGWQIPPEASPPQAQAQQ